MADWSSSLDSGVNSAVAGNRWHAIEVRVRVEGRVRGEDEGIRVPWLR